jgi:hypothetical protein
LGSPVVEKIEAGHPELAHLEDVKRDWRFSEKIDYAAELRN